MPIPSGDQRNDSLPPPIDLAKQIAQRSKGQDLNEADTRHQIIDEVLHGVLAWPRELTKTESYIAPGFADYCLTRPDGTLLIFLEAKRQGNYFQIPGLSPDDASGRYVQTKVLLTDKAVRAAIEQVHTYCVNAGCHFAGVTNGHQWIIFRTFQANQEWRELQAFVIPSLEFFHTNFTEAVNSFGYKAITQAGSLGRLLGSNPAENRPLYYPKQDILAYGATIHANTFASQLGPIVKQYFDKLPTGDPEFMATCYVAYKAFNETFRSARARLADSLTPYLQQQGIQSVDNVDSGGTFRSKLEKSALRAPQSDVIVLFGGKGVGKSTFLRRLLFHRPPQILRKHAVACIIDLLNTPELKEDIYSTIWATLAADLDIDNLLKAERPKLLELFADRYEQVKRQTLYGLDEKSETYQLELNKQLQLWLADSKYCARQLAALHAHRHRGIIVVIDNTDQYSPAIQEFCFTVAHEISNELQCLAVISMREERFYSSSIRGTLDAYHNYGFHISSPSPADVFIRRIQYVLTLLSKKSTRVAIWGSDVDSTTLHKITKLFRIFENEFTSSQSHLANFLTASAQGDIRLALTIFREFLLSRYTNVQEMTSVTGLWTILVHQVLKPIMIPYRFFYSENESVIPNVYQIRSAKRGSHFTALRILQSLAFGDPANSPFTPVPKLLAEFVQVFNMQEDFVLNIDVLLRFKLIESDNRMDTYTMDLDSVRITDYGRYMLDEMSKFFTYIELVSIDCGLFDERVAHSLTTLANQEYDIFAGGLTSPARRLRRVQLRLEKAELFIRHLIAEEDREFSLYALQDRSRIAPAILERFLPEKEGVLRSAGKQRSRTTFSL